jgi:hypothetical protein
MAEYKVAPSLRQSKKEHGVELLGNTYRGSTVTRSRKSGHAYRATDQSVRYCALSPRDRRADESFAIRETCERETADVEQHQRDVRLAAVYAPASSTVADASAVEPVLGDKPWRRSQTKVAHLDQSTKKGRVAKQNHFNPPSPGTMTPDRTGYRITSSVSASRIVIT